MIHKVHRLQDTQIVMFIPIMWWYSLFIFNVGILVVSKPIKVQSMQDLAKSIHKWEIKPTWNGLCSPDGAMKNDHVKSWLCKIFSQNSSLFNDKNTHCEKITKFKCSFWLISKSILCYANRHTHTCKHRRKVVIPTLIFVLNTIFGKFYIL